MSIAVLAVITRSQFTIGPPAGSNDSQARQARRKASWNDVLGEIGVDDDPAGAGEQASVIGGVRGRQALIRAEPGAFLRFHEPSVAPGPRPPHR